MNWKFPTLLVIVVVMCHGISGSKDGPSFQEMVARLAKSDLPMELKKRIIKTVAHKVQEIQISDFCPDGFTQQMCNQPPTFYVWLRKLREQMMQKEMERSKFCPIFLLNLK